VSSLKTTKKIENSFNIIGSFVLTAFYAAASPVQQYFRMYYDFFRFCLLIGFVTINGVLTFLEGKKWFHEKSPSFKLFVAGVISLFVFLSTGLGFLVGVSFLVFAAPILFCLINGMTAMVNALEAKGHAMLEKEGDELLKKWKNDSIEDPITQTEAYLNKGALSEGYHWLKDKLKFVWGVNCVIHFFESCGEKMTKRRQRWQEQLPKTKARLKRLFKSNAYESMDSSSSDSTRNTNEEVKKQDFFDFSDSTNKKVIMTAIEMKVEAHHEQIKYKAFDTFVSLALIPANLLLFHVFSIAQVALVGVTYGISCLLAVSTVKTVSLMVTEEKKSYLDLAQEVLTERDRVDENSVTATSSYAVLIGDPMMVCTQDNQTAHSPTTIATTTPAPSSDNLIEQASSSKFNSKDKNKPVSFVNCPSPIAI
jgi:hypothetical protein